MAEIVVARAGTTTALAPSGPPPFVPSRAAGADGSRLHANALTVALT